MNKSMIVLFFLVVFAAVAYYCYQEGYFNTQIAHVEQVLNEICDPEKEDCSSFEADLEV